MNHVIRGLYIYAEPNREWRQNYDAKAGLRLKPVDPTLAIVDMICRCGCITVYDIWDNYKSLLDRTLKGPLEIPKFAEDDDLLLFVANFPEFSQQPRQFW